MVRHGISSLYGRTARRSGWYHGEIFAARIFSVEGDVSSPAIELVVELLKVFVGNELAIHTALPCFGSITGQADPIRCYTPTVNGTGLPAMLMRKEVIEYIPDHKSFPHFITKPFAYTTVVRHIAKSIYIFVQTLNILSVTPLRLFAHVRNYISCDI